MPPFPRLRLSNGSRVGEARDKGREREEVPCPWWSCPLVRQAAWQNGQAWPLSGG
jgi:hypothetical protein